MWDFLLDLLFPKRCVSCGKFSDYLCPACLPQIKFVENPICPICERLAIDGVTHPICRSKYSLDGLTAVCVYDGPIKAAIKRLKYKPWISALGGSLNSLMLRYFQNNPSIIRIIEQNPTVTPVPLHKSREYVRGFNQSALLGKLVAEGLNLEFVPNLLIRHKKTKPQAELKGRERKENIKDAFVINHNSQFLIQNSHILLIDDIWTTGATIRTCGQVLKRAGIKNVWALTLAR